MKIGSLKEVQLTSAKDTFLFDYQVAGLDPEIMSAYRNVLTLFIGFTGDILVKELTSDHVQLYIANLSDGPNEGDEHMRLVMSHFAVIDIWLRWLDAQRLLTERDSGSVDSSCVTTLFPVPSSTRNLAYCC